MIVSGILELSTGYQQVINRLLTEMLITFGVADGRVLASSALVWPPHRMGEGLRGL